MDKIQEVIEEYLSQSSMPMRVQIQEGGPGSGNFGHAHKYYVDYYPHSESYGVQGLSGRSGTGKVTFDSPDEAYQEIESDINSHLTPDDRWE